MNTAKDLTSQAMYRGLEGIAQFFTNVMQGIVENVEITSNHVIREQLQEVAARNMPFRDKLDELSRIGSTIPDDMERKRFMEKLVEVEQDGQRARQGLDEIRRHIRRSGICEEDKKRILGEVDRCESTLKNIYVITVPAHSYKNVMKLANQEGMLKDTTAMFLSSGEYALFYPVYYAQSMDRILQVASLMYEHHPLPEAIRTEAVVTSTNKSEAAILRIENVTPELAEYAVLESGKRGFIAMAKEERTDGSGQFDLICNAGDSKEEKDRNYREAIELVAKSAIVLSGPSASTEQAKMRHSAREYDSLLKGLNGSGYIFSVSTKDTKIGDERTQMIYPRNFVRFSQEKFRTYNRGVASKLVVNRSEADLRYDSMLYAASQSGTGQKVFISDEKMAELETAADRAYRNLSSMLEGTEVKDRLDIAAELSNRTLSWIERREELKQQNDTQGWKAAAEEARMLRAQTEALSMARGKDVTKAMVFERVVASELDKHRFRYYPSQKESLEAGAIVRKATEAAIRESRKEAALETENRMIPEVPGDKNDRSIGWEAIENELARLTPEPYLNQLMARMTADQDPSMIPYGKVPVSEIRKANDILDREFDQAKKKAADLLKDIRIRTQEIGIGIEAYSIETPVAERNAKILKDYIKNTDMRLCGEEPENQDSRKPAWEEHKSSRPKDYIH